MLYAHPFAEEMNKTRRMASLGARALAADGWTVLLVDFAGCGDSTGDFGDATWERWRDDLRAAWDWLAAHADGPRWLWGLRAGCLIALEMTTRLEAKPPLLLWQPVLSGKQHLGQFLRLRLARERIDGGGSAHDTRALREELAGGRALEIAGYEVSPALAEGLDAAELDLDGYPEKVHWLEVGTGDPPDLGPGARARVERWRGGATIHSRAVPGAAFWQTVEITECPALVEATVAALAQASS
jgi:exosortase A-associated hydrolase 2